MQLVFTPAPVVFHANLAVAEAAAVAGWVEILTVTPAVAGRSTYAAAGAAAIAHAAAAITSDRASALVDRVVAGRPQWFNEHLAVVGGAPKLLLISDQIANTLR